MNATLAKIEEDVKKVLAFGEKHFKIILAVLVIICVLGGINAVINHFTISNLSADVQRLGATNSAILGYASDLAKQVDTGDSIATQLRRENSGLTASLESIRSDYSKLAESNKHRQSDLTGLTEANKRIRTDSEGTASNNIEAERLIDSVQNDIKGTLGKGSGTK